MKIKLLATILLALGFLFPTYGQKKKDKKKASEVTTPAYVLKTKTDTISYCLGILFGGTLANNNLSAVDTKILAAAMDSALAKKTPLFDEAKANELIGKYVMEQNKIKAEKNLAEGKAFLENNKKQEGVIELPSGLQYKILKEGNGPKPDSGAKVTVHYHGTLIDGKVFDSSVERGEPIQLSVDNVIPGWKEALHLMPVGSKWKLFIPASLGYGENPPPGAPIGPNSVLVFEVELLSIDKDQPQDANSIQNVNPSSQTK